MREAWNKGLTKASHASVRKVADTMRKRKTDNLARWRTEARRTGLLKSEYPRLKRDGDLAELIGVILGDGHIGVFPRTESLRIVASANNPGFVDRYATLVEVVFGKKPHVKKRSKSEAVNITIYEKYISKRLGVPSGARGRLEIVVPRWVLRSKALKVRFLRGLYEAEGSECHHEPTYTHKMLFSNQNQSLLDIVHNIAESLGFHPHASRYQIQISRKAEVQNFKNLIKFRCY